MDSIDIRFHNVHLLFILEMLNLYDALFMFILDTHNVCDISVAMNSAQNTQSNFCHLYLFRYDFYRYLY